MTARNRAIQGRNTHTLNFLLTRTHTRRWAMKELLRDVKCKSSCFSGSSRRNGYLHLNLREELERKLGLIR